MLPQGWCDLPDDWRTRTKWDGWHKSRAKEIGCTYDKARADEIVGFMQTHKLVKGRWGGQRVTLMPWFEHQAVRPFYAYKDEDDRRRFRRCDIWTAKKSSKTTSGSLVASEALFWEQEAGAEVYSFACDREQAALIYQSFAPMVDGHPRLSEISKRLDTNKRIVYPKLNAFYSAESSEVASKAGKQPSCVIFDELAFQPNRLLWDMATQGAFAARLEPQLWVMSTAGYDRNGIGYEEYGYARQVRDGIIDDKRLLPVIWETPDEADWNDPEVWKLANPSLILPGQDWGVFDMENLEAEHRKAVERPANENSFRMLRLNQWVSQETRYIPITAWDNCTAEPHLFTGREWFGGIDLSTTTDITAWVEIAFESGFCDVNCHFWLPGATVEDAERRDHVPYREWARAGLMTLTEGDIVDYSVVRGYVNSRAEILGMPYEVGFDPWSARQFCEVELPFDGFTMAQVRQGYATLSAPTKQLLELIISGKLRHGGNPILRWMADNCVAMRDPAGNVKLDKGKATARIDGIAALINALDRHSRRMMEQASGPLILDIDL